MEAKAFVRTTEVLEMKITQNGLGSAPAGAASLFAALPKRPIAPHSPDGGSSNDVTLTVR